MAWQPSVEPYLSRPRGEWDQNSPLSSHLWAHRAGVVQTSRASDGGFQRPEKKCAGKKRTHILSSYKEFLSKTCLLSGLYSLSHIQRHLIKHSRENDKALVHLCRTDNPFLGRLLSSFRLYTREKWTVCHVRQMCRTHESTAKHYGRLAQAQLRGGCSLGSGSILWPLLAIRSGWDDWGWSQGQIRDLDFKKWQRAKLSE